MIAGLFPGETEKRRKELFKSTGVKADNNPLAISKERAEEELKQAIKQEDVDAIIYAVELGANPNIRANNTYCPIHIAAQKARQDAVDLLLSKGADVNSLDGAHRTAIHRAIFNKDLGMVKKLAGKKAKLDGYDAYGTHIVNYAASFGTPEIMRELSDHGASFYETDKKYHTGAIDAAATSGNYAVAEYLLDNGLTLKPHVRGGYSPLYHAIATSGNKDIVRLFIDRGADVNFTEHDGHTALHRAAMEGNDKIASMLITAGANVNARDWEGKTPLHYAVKHNRPEVARVLVERKAFLDAKDYNNAAPVTYATSREKSKIATFLFSKGAKKPQNVDDGATPLHRAVRAGHLEAVEDLLDKLNTDVNALDRKNQTPLHIAAELGHCQITHRLIQEGSSPEIKDKNGATAFHLAVARGGPEVTQLFVEAHAKEGVLDNKGRTPLDIARTVENAAVDEKTLRALQNRYGEKKGMLSRFASKITGR